MFRSLFCLKGTDTRSRFLAICCGCWALLLILPVLFGTSPYLLLFALPLCFVLFAASQRAGSDKPVYGLALTGLYLLAFLLITFGFGIAAMVMTLIAVVPAILIARQALAVIKGAVQGYLSPGQRPASASAARRREPVFGDASDDTESAFEPDYSSQAHTAHAEPAEPRSGRDTDPMADLRALVQANPRLLPGVVVVAAVVLIGIVTVSLWPESAGEPEVPPIAEPTQVAAETRDEVKLPDGFSLGLVDGKLVMSWLGDKGEAGELWSLASAKGDKRCSVLKFNNGSEYRPVSVLMTADTVTEAWFSPLDAKAVIQDVAMRGNAQLCGYKFSLKGTQSRLEAHRAFAPYL